MAGNYFDQFDPPAVSSAPAATPAPSAAPQANYFDQFDAAYAAAAPAAAGPRPTADVQAEFDALPWYAKPLKAADDDIRLLADGATFGLADKAAGALTGTGTDAQRTLTQEARERAGAAALPAEVGGSFMTAGGLAKNGATLLGRGGTAAMDGLKGLAARTGLAGVEGAGYGAANAAGHDQDVGHGTLLGAVFGAGGNAAAEGMTGAVNKVAGLFNKAPVIPNVDEVQQAAQNAYKAADAAGVVYTPQAVLNLNQNIERGLAGMGYDPALQPGAAAVVKRLGDLTGQNVTLTGLDTLRKVAQNGFIQGNASNNKAVGLMVKAIDDAVANPASGDVLMGNASAGAAALQQARSLWSRVAKANTVQDAVDSAQLRAASTGTGGNIDNATRQNLRGVYENGNSFTPDENDALRTAIMGTPAQNALRMAGKFAPTGVVSSGLGGGVGAWAGHTLFGPEGGTLGAIAVPAAAFAAKHAADAMTANHVNDLMDVIMAGGTKAATKAAPNAVQKAAKAARDPLSRLYMLDGVDAQNGGR